MKGWKGKRCLPCPLAGLSSGITGIAHSVSLKMPGTPKGTGRRWDCVSALCYTPAIWKSVSCTTLRGVTVGCAYKKPIVRDQTSSSWNQWGIITFSWSPISALIDVSSAIDSKPLMNSVVYYISASFRCKTGELMLMCCIVHFSLKLYMCPPLGERCSHNQWSLFWVSFTFLVLRKIHCNLYLLF